MEEDTEPIVLKQRKPRSDAQSAALEKARTRAAEMRATRFKNASGENEPDEEPQPQDEPQEEQQPEPLTEKKPRKPRAVKPKAVKFVEQQQPEAIEEEPEPEPEDVKQYRREVQAVPPPTPKQHFRMIQSMNKSYMLYEE